MECLEAAAKKSTVPIIMAALSEVEERNESHRSEVASSGEAHVNARQRERSEVLEMYCEESMPKIPPIRLCYAMQRVEWKHRTIFGGID